MKKTYLKPENTVVALNVRSNILGGSEILSNQANSTNGTELPGQTLSREVIQTPDPWEDEW